MRTKTHKLTVDQISGAGELYDLVNDPNELENLFECPEHDKIRVSLESYLSDRPDDLRAPLSQSGMA